MPTGPDAARLKRRKRRLLAQLGIPADALPGSLALTHRRCGKSTCHCAEGEGHPLYLLTFMVDGKKHVEPIPADWIEATRPAVELGRDFKNAIAAINFGEPVVLRAPKSEISMSLCGLAGALNGKTPNK